MGTYKYRKKGWIDRGLLESTLAVETAVERNGGIRDRRISKINERESITLR